MLAVGDVVRSKRPGLRGKRSRLFKVLRINTEAGTIRTVDQNHRIYTFDKDEVKPARDFRDRFVLKDLPRWAKPRRRKRR